MPFQKNSTLSRKNTLSGNIFNTFNLATGKVGTLPVSSSMRTNGTTGIRPRQFSIGTTESIEVEGEDHVVIGPGDYILTADPANDSLNISLGGGFNVGGSVHIGTILRGQFLSIKNNTGNTVTYSFQIVGQDTIDTNSSSVGNGEIIAAFTNNALDGAQIDFYLEPHGVGLVLTGTIVIAISPQIKYRSPIYMNQQFISIDGDVSSRGIMINNDGLAVDTYIGLNAIAPIKGIDYNISVVIAPVNRLIITNGTGLPLDYSYMDTSTGTLYRGISNGGALPGLTQTGGTSGIVASLAVSPNFDVNGMLMSQVMVGTFTPVTSTVGAFDLKAPQSVGTISYDGDTPVPISAASNNTFLDVVNVSRGPLNVEFGSSLVGDLGQQIIAVGAHIDSSEQNLVFSNATNLPLMMVIAASRIYTVIAAGDTFTFPHAVNGLFGIAIVPGGTVGTSVYVAYQDASSPFVSVGSLSSPIPNGNNVLLINGDPASSADIPITANTNATAVIVSSGTGFTVSNSDTSSFLVNDTGLNMNFLPGNNLPSDEDLAGILYLIQSSDNGGRIDYSKISSSVVEIQTQTYTAGPAPIAPDPVSFEGAQYSEVFYVIPDLTQNRDAVIVNIYSQGTQDVYVTNNSGFMILFRIMDASATVPIGESYLLPVSSQFTMLVPVASTASNGTLTVNGSASI